MEHSVYWTFTNSWWRVSTSQLSIYNLLTYFFVRWWTDWTEDSLHTWFALVCRISFGRLCNRADEWRPSNNCSSLQDIVHGLCSVQRLSGSWWDRHRHLLTILWAVSLRHCSRFLHDSSSPLPHWSLCIRQEYVTIIICVRSANYFAAFDALLIRDRSPLTQNIKIESLHMQHEW